MKIFHKLLGVALLVATTNNFVWFALVFWAYLETQSVIATSTIGGLFLVAGALSGFWFGSIVDHNKKKNSMIASSVASLSLYALGFVIYTTQNPEMFTSITSPFLWVFISIMLLGSVAGGIYNIAIPTLVSVLINENERDKANGKFGTVMGLAFGITSVASGLVLGFLGMWYVIIIAIISTVFAIIFLSSISIPEENIIHTHTKEEPDKKIDIKGTISVIRKVPGLFPLIFFTTFNNLLGGVFMALMDAYGLTLVSVQTWGLIFGVLSFGFIIGGLYISKKGLGNNPLRSLFRINIYLWTICIVMTIQPSIVLLVLCMALWMPMMPFVEATEQTIFQKVVPPERLGRVFGFAHSVEQSASPMTAFLIGPIAEAFFIPYMTTGNGVLLIGDWFGVGKGRGIALVFITSGIIGLLVTILAMKSKSYAVLSTRYKKN